MSQARPEVSTTLSRAQFIKYLWRTGVVFSAATVCSSILNALYSSPARAQGDGGAGDGGGDGDGGDGAGDGGTDGGGGPGGPGGPGASTPEVDSGSLSVLAATATSAVVMYRQFFKSKD